MRLAALLLATSLLSGCATAALVGAGAIAADTIVEETQGGDRLF